MSFKLPIAFIAFVLVYSPLFSNEVSSTKDACITPFHLLNNEDFPKIELSELQGARELPLKGYPGAGHSFLGTGMYGGQKVFVKYPDRQREKNLRQERYVKFLSDHGIGPKFLGIIDEGPRKRAIVTEFIQGHHLAPFIENIPSEIKISMDTYRDIVKIKEKLIELGLVGGKDAQVRVREDGRAFLIDPEFLEFRSSPIQGDTVVLSEINEMLKNVKASLVQRGLWKEEK